MASRMFAHTKALKKAQQKKYTEKAKQEQRFKCEKCDKCFASSQNLTIHIDKQFCDKIKPTEKERRNISNTKYYENNKSKIEEKQKQTKEVSNIEINCECGSIVKKYNIYKHRKTKKHMNYLEKQN